MERKKKTIHGLQILIVIKLHKKLTKEFEYDVFLMNKEYCEFFLVENKNILLIKIIIIKNHKKCMPSINLVE